MLECFSLSEQSCAILREVELPFEARQKSRHRCETRCGLALGWILPRGRVLADGDVLLANDGSGVRVIAAAESVSEVNSEDALLLMRAAYHLGNRHVPLQIDAGRLRYQHDHVLDDMLAGLGLAVRHNLAPFHPESGAYHSASSHSAHHHDHDGHQHAHPHGHAH